MNRPAHWRCRIIDISNFETNRVLISDPLLRHQGRVLNPLEDSRGLNARAPFRENANELYLALSALANFQIQNIGYEIQKKKTKNKIIKYKKQKYKTQRENKLIIE